MTTSNSLPIIDAHHHYWDPVANYHPWLRDEPMIPFRYGDYSTIRTQFLPAEYDAVSRQFNVVATVTMEGEFDEANLVEESAWMTRVAKQHATPEHGQRPAAHVARAILHRGDAAKVLAGHAQYPLVRGIRHKPATSATPFDIEPGASGSMSDPAWQDGYRCLAQHGLHFELQAPWWHVGELLDLIEAFPDTPVVINHCFMPVDRSAAGLQGWKQALARAARAPNLTMKISGIGINAKSWSLEDQRPIIDACIDTFGPARCMFASNFPVDGLVGTFDTIFGGFLSATSDLSEAERSALFHDTANRVYRLGRPLGAASSA